MRSLSILHISFTAKAILKKPIYFIIDSIINLLYPTKKARQNKSLVILRNDAIGDYLLFRDFLRVIRKEYSNYHVTLIGNIVFQDIALCLDKTYIDKFIWIDRIKFSFHTYFILWFCIICISNSCGMCTCLYNYILYDICRRGGGVGNNFPISFSKPNIYDSMANF